MPAQPPVVPLRGRGPSEWFLPAALLFVTLLTTTFAGLFYATGEMSLFRIGAAVLARPSLLLSGLPFSVTFMGILLAHEMGHYVACRHYGIRCTPPFFIPLPTPLVGTLGAFIRIKSPFPHKRALFDVGIAGPLAGFALVVPALIVGIGRSRLIAKGALEGVDGVINFGEPLLFRLVGKLVLDYSPASQDMLAHPIAMGAWFGLLATCLNLLPVWQLDGGHIAYAMLGRESQRKLSIAVVGLLVLTSFLSWPVMSYLVFGLLLIFLGARFGFYHPPTLFEQEELGRARIPIGVLALAILIVSFTPVPIWIA